MESAVATARAVLGEGTRSARVYALMGMEGRFTHEPETGKTSYGPRRVLYPQITSMRDDEMALGPDPALMRDRNLTDELVEFVEDLAIWLLTRPD
jgi:hypothetical protein